MVFIGLSREESSASPSPGLTAKTEDQKQRPVAGSWQRCSGKAQIVHLRQRLLEQVSKARAGDEVASSGRYGVASGTWSERCSERQNL